MMKKQLLLVMAFCAIAAVSAQKSGINTDTPQGALDVTTTNNSGMVMPRVATLEDVTATDGGVPAIGTGVYVTSINQYCYYLETGWTCLTENGPERGFVDQPDYDSPVGTYFKASNSDADDQYGYWNAIDDSGRYLVVTSRRESSNVSGVQNGTTSSADNTSARSGAGYIYYRDDANPNPGTNNWVQQAFLKAPTNTAGSTFGYRAAMAGNGATVAIAETFSQNGATGTGQVHIYTRSGTTWSFVQTLSASNAGNGDAFGSSVELNSDGTRIVIGAFGEDTGADGIDPVSDNLASNAGAAYIFSLNSGTWTQDAFLKASNSAANNQFGWSSFISDDGNTVAVGARRENGNATGVFDPASTQATTTGTGANDSGAVYVYTRDETSGNWSQQAYIKASNTGAGDEYGYSLALSADGNTMAVGGRYEDSDSDQNNTGQALDNATRAGAVYVYLRTDTTWQLQDYLKVASSQAGDEFGRSVSLSNDGDTLAVGAVDEDSEGTGVSRLPINNTAGVANNENAVQSGAAYIFFRGGNSWTLFYTVKAEDFAQPDARFGRSINFSSDARTVAVGARFDDSGTDLINGPKPDVDATADRAGAVFLFQAQD